MFSAILRWSHTGFFQKPTIEIRGIRISAQLLNLGNEHVCASQQTTSTPHSKPSNKISKTDAGNSLEEARKGGYAHRRRISGTLQADLIQMCGNIGDGGVDPILRANRNLWIVFRRYHGLAFLR